MYKRQVYLRTLLSFGPFFVMNNVMLAFVRNDGGPGRAMCGMVVGSLSNVVMDYVFIFPLGMGMFGAALATGVSPLISLLILSGHLRAPGRGFHLLRTRPHLRLLPALCTPGLPSLISELSSVSYTHLRTGVPVPIAPRNRAGRCCFQIHQRVNGAAEAGYPLYLPEAAHPRCV